MSRTFIGCLSSAALLALPFLFPFLFPLAWVAFLPLFWLLHEAGGLRRAFLCGWLTGWLGYLFGFHWLVYTISVFGGYSYPVSGLIFLLFAALEAFQFALFAALVHRFGFGPLALFPPLFWVALEFWFPLLFPWQLATTQTSFSLLIQNADLVGPYGVSFLLMWFNAIVYALLFGSEAKSRARFLPIALAGVAFTAALIYGVFRLDQVAGQMRAAPALTVAAVQGNIDVDMKWDPKKIQSNLRAYLKLTEQAGAATLVIWPETAIEEWVPEPIQQLPKEVMPQLQSDDSFFIFGARSFRGNLSGPNLKAFNSAFLTDSDGRVRGHYHKQVLLAFGEYIPFARWLAKLPGFPSLEGFTPGDGPRTLDLPGGVKVAPLICYEDLLPELARGFVREAQANVLVNLTNDAWYGRSVAPWQHAWLAQWRAVETRRSLIRVTNTGLTSVIDAKGELLQTLPLFIPAVLTAEVEILGGETFYVRHGDWFAWGISVMALLVAALLWRRPARLPGS